MIKLTSLLKNQGCFANKNFEKTSPFKFSAGKRRNSHRMAGIPHSTFFSQFDSTCGAL